jgi:hypothetical protein
LQTARRERRIVADGTISGRPSPAVLPRAARCAASAGDCRAAADRAAAALRGDGRMPPATARRSPSESRYKKSNKYFMREIL